MILTDAQQAEIATAANAMAEAVAEDALAGLVGKWDGKTLKSLGDAVDINSYIEEAFVDWLDAYGLETAISMTNIAFAAVEASWQ